MSSGNAPLKTILAPVGVTVSVTALPLLTVIGVGGLSVLIAEDIAIPAAGVGGGVAAFFASSALSSVPAGRLVERIGARRAIRVAALGCGAAMLLMAALVNSWALLVITLVFAGLANGIAQPAANVHLLRSVPHERQGIAFGAKQAALPIAGVLVGASIPLIALRVGWRWTYVIAAAAALTLAAVPAGERLQAVRVSMPVRRALIRDHRLILMATVGGIGSGIGNAMAAYLVPYAAFRGISLGTAGLVLSGASAASVITRFLLGVLVDRSFVRVWRVMGLLFLLGTVGLLGIGRGESLLVVSVAAGIAFGAGWGWPGLLHLAVARHRIGSPASTTAAAMVGIYAGAVIGPLGFAMIFAIFGSYRLAWSLLALLALVAALLGFLLDRATYQQGSSLGHG